MNAFTELEMRVLTACQKIDVDRLQSDKLLDIVLMRRFGVEYQPIVEVQAEEVVGYQAQACFWTATQRPIHAGEMFACLHRNPLLLYHVELEIKKLQIAQAPTSGWLMLNLDIDSFFEAGDDLNNVFLQLLKQYAWSDRELIINIVENHHMSDAYRSQRMIALLQQSGTAIALEDVGVRWGMFSLSAFLDASVIRFNGAGLRALNEKAAQATVDWLVSAARRIGVQTIMSGVDACDQFDWAKRLGVDCVQGRLFERQSIQMR